MNKLKNNPEQFSIDTISETAKFLLYWGLCDIAISKVGELAKTVSEVMSAELQILKPKTKEIKAATDGIFNITAIENVDTPILCSIRTTEDLINIEAKYELGIAEDALKIIRSSDKEFIKESGGISNELENFIAEIRNKTTIENAIYNLERTSGATKVDIHHAFPDIIDNYVGDAIEFSIPTKGPGGIVIRQSKLYQVEGSLNGKSGGQT